jgi:hypothetical protein
MTRRAPGAIALLAVLVLTAAVLVPVWLIVRLGVLALVAGWGWTPGDATWNDGDAAIGLGFGGLGLVVVLGLAAAGCALVARWAGFRARAVVGGLAVAAAVALAVAVLPVW